MGAVSNISSASRVHAVTIGHETVMGKATFFSGPLPVNREFDLEAEYPFLEELPDSKTKVRRIDIKYRTCGGSINATSHNVN